MAVTRTGVVVQSGRMSRSTRRSFLIGAGCVTTAALIDSAAAVDKDAAVRVADPELRRLIERERNNIRVKKIIDVLLEQNSPRAPVASN